jgi:hypothetical protein
MQKVARGYFKSVKWQSSCTYELRRTTAKIKTKTRQRFVEVNCEENNRVIGNERDFGWICARP